MLRSTTLQLFTTRFVISILGSTAQRWMELGHCVELHPPKEEVFFESHHPPFCLSVSAPLSFSLAFFNVPLVLVVMMFPSARSVQVFVYNRLFAIWGLNGLSPAVTAAKERPPGGWWTAVGKMLGTAAYH